MLKAHSIVALHVLLYHLQNCKPLGRNSLFFRYAKESLANETALDTLDNHVGRARLVEDLWIGVK